MRCWSVIEVAAIKAPAEANVQGPSRMNATGLPLFSIESQSKMLSIIDTWNQAGVHLWWNCMLINVRTKYL